MSMPSTLPDAVGTHARETNASRCVTFLEVTEDKVRALTVGGLFRES